MSKVFVKSNQYKPQSLRNYRRSKPTETKNYLVYLLPIVSFLIGLVAGVLL